MYFILQKKILNVLALEFENTCKNNNLYSRVSLMPRLQSLNTIFHYKKQGLLVIMVIHVQSNKCTRQAWNILFSKTNRVILKGLKNHHETKGFGQRWNNLSFNKNNYHGLKLHCTFQIHKFIMITKNNLKVKITHWLLEDARKLIILKLIEK